MSSSSSFKDSRSVDDDLNPFLVVSSGGCLSCGRDEVVFSVLPSGRGGQGEAGPSCGSRQQQPMYGAGRQGGSTCGVCVLEVLREFEGCVRKIRHRREQLKQKVEREAASMMELSEQHRLRRQHKRKRDRLKDRARVLRRLVEERRRENERERERIEGAREALGRSRRRDEDLFRGEGDAAAATLASLRGREDKARVSLTRERSLALSSLLSVIPLEAEVASFASRPEARVTTRVCGLRLPTSAGAMARPSQTPEQEEHSSALGYALLLIDLASRILHSPVLHVSCLSWGGDGAGMQGYTCSRSTIWQPESFWRLLPGTPEEELPLFSASKQKQPQWDQGLLATLGASSSPQSSPSSSVGLAAEDAEMRADEAVLLLSRSVGVVCAHLGHQHGDGGHDDHHPSLSRQPLALLCHLCSEFIGLDLVKRTDLDEEVDDDDLSLLEGSEMLRVPGPHDPSAAAGMDFSVIVQPAPAHQGVRSQGKQSLEEWDVLDLPERRSVT